jgi:isocitrate/isopropylmalate dehydrogenase
METLKLAVVAGDGIGKEITDEGVKVVKADAELSGYSLEFRYADMGGVAFDKTTAHMDDQTKTGIDDWDDERKTRLTFPQETIDVLDWARNNGGAVIFGSVGRNDLPKRVAELALLAMRKRYNVNNNRPMIIDPILAHNSILFREPIAVPGFVVVSPEESMFNPGENGSYVTSDGAPAAFAWTRKPFTRSKLEKTVKEAFELARGTGSMIMCASKYNVLVSEKMLSEVFAEVARQYEGRVRLNPNTNWDKDKKPTGQLIIDNAGMQIASNPERYANTVVVADAMFGDFLRTIVSVVSGAVPVNREALQQIREQGLYRTCIRELCSGLYFGERKTGKEFCFDTNYYDAKTIKDLAALGRSIGRGTLGSSDLDSLEVEDIPLYNFWRQTLDSDAKSEVYRLRHLNVARSVAKLLTDPASLRTVVACNMMGDIYSDLAGAVVGKSLGLLPSSSENTEGFGIYEQIAGTAPDIAGKNEANPIAQIRSCAMMLGNIHDTNSQSRIDRAITRALAVARTKDIWEPGYELVSTSKMGDYIVQFMKEKK